MPWWTTRLLCVVSFIVLGKKKDMENSLGKKMDERKQSIGTKLKKTTKTLRVTYYLF